MLKLLLNYLKNNENLNKIDENLNKESEEYKVRIPPYILDLYSYINHSTIFSVVSDTHSKIKIKARNKVYPIPGRDIVRFKYYLIHRLSINSINKHETEKYYLKKKEFKESKKFKELFFKNIQHHFKNNFNETKNFENQKIFGAKYFTK